MNLFGLIGFGAAFAGFVVLAVLLGAARGGRVPAARRLTVAVGMSALWALTLALETAMLPIPPIAILAAEFLRDAAWLIAMLGLAPATLPRPFAPASYALLALWAATALAGMRIAG